MRRMEEGRSWVEQNTTERMMEMREAEMMRWACIWEFPKENKDRKRDEFGDDTHWRAVRSQVQNHIGVLLSQLLPLISLS